MLDIFIPVRNRFYTLQHTLKTCISFISSDIRLHQSTIIILDCGSSDIPQTWIQSLPEVVVYARTSANLSMSANWERCFDYMSNKYFTFVGSDDGLIYNKCSVDNIFNYSHIDCFFWQKISFVWPNTTYEGSSAFFNYPVPITYKNPNSLLVDILNFKIPWNSLPTVYSGIICSEFARKVKSLVPEKRFFWNSVPDICSGINLLKYKASLFHLPLSLGISGVSASSNGYAFISKKRTRETVEFESRNQCTADNPRFSTNTSLTPLGMTAEILLKDMFSPPYFSHEIIVLAMKCVAESDNCLRHKAPRPEAGIRARIIRFLFPINIFATIADFAHSQQSYYAKLYPIFIFQRLDSTLLIHFNRIINSVNFALLLCQLWILKLFTP